MTVTHEQESNDLVLDPAEFDNGDEHVIPDPDALFQVLSRAIRRRILFYLLDVPETTVDELANTLAGRRSMESGVLGLEEGEQIATELRHVHLPLLASADIVEYDSVTGDVRLLDIPDPVRETIRFAHRYERDTDNV